MRVTETYFQKNRTKKKQNNEDAYADFFELERKQKHMSALNMDSSVMQETVFKGINSEQSIFDKTAVFHTK